MVRYARHDLHGLLVIDKPLGPSSTDVVRKVRWLGGNCKVGHAGTLDPMATGVLICCIGSATKAVPSLMGMTKQYLATLDLSHFSTTDDSEGALQPVLISTPPTADQLRIALDTLTGLIQQTPPIHSAVLVHGQRAYKLARQGLDVVIEPRIVRIDRIDILRYDCPILQIAVTCGKGTYIRSLARQIGQALGTGGYLTALCRSAIGPYRVEQAAQLDRLPKPLLSEHLIPWTKPGQSESFPGASAALGIRKSSDDPSQ
ncbi:MAG: tRNA pseudouridine(55) synthase TruB [Phycisphaeraceae bacterium]